MNESELESLRNKVMQVADLNKDGKIELGEFSKYIFHILSKLSI